MSPAGNWNDPNLMVMQLFRPKKSVVLMALAKKQEPPPALLTLWHRLRNTTEHAVVPLELIYPDAKV